MDLVVLEPCFPADCTSRLLWAGIATLAQAPGCFARQEDRENDTVHPTLLEPDPRQLSRGVDLRTAHVRQATGWAWRSEEHTSELQSHLNLVCRLLLETKN